MRLVSMWVLHLLFWQKSSSSFLALAHPLLSFVGLVLSSGIMINIIMIIIVHWRFFLDSLSLHCFFFHLIDFDTYTTSADAENALQKKGKKVWHGKDRKEVESIEKIQFSFLAFMYEMRIIWQRGKMERRIE